MRKSFVTKILPASILCTALISGCDNKVSEGTCAVDTVNGVLAGEVTKVKKPAILPVSGWAFDDRSRSVPAEVSIELLSSDGKVSVTGAAARGTKRPDVAKVYGSEEYIAAGFDGAVNVEKAPLGRYSIWIIQKSGATQLSCNSTRFVELQ